MAPPIGRAIISLQYTPDIDLPSIFEEIAKQLHESTEPINHYVPSYNRLRGAHSCVEGYAAMASRVISTLFSVVNCLAALISEGFVSCAVWGVNPSRPDSLQALKRARSRVEKAGV